MTETIAKYEAKPKRDIFDFSPASAIAGKRITGVMLKRRKADTKHPENRMFLMFDDGSGFELFAGGPIFPWNIHRDCDYKHLVRRRTDSGEYRTLFFAGEPEGDDKRMTVETLRKRKRPPSGNDCFDKSDVLEILGKRINGIRMQSETRNGLRNNLALIFSDGSVYEFVAAGHFIVCSKLESFDLYRLYKRGQNAYENEVLVISDPDGEGVAVVINKIYEFPPSDGDKKNGTADRP